MITTSWRDGLPVERSERLFSKGADFQAELKFQAALFNQKK
jgi:hypothetical protein